MVPTTLDRDLIARLRLGVMRLARRLRQEGSGGMSPSTLSALATIDRKGPLSLRELAEAERVQPPTVTRVVTRLEEEGLIERTPDERDRRVVRVSLTATGREVLERARDRQSRSLEERLRRLSPDELDDVARVVALLDRLLEQGEEA